MMLNLDVVDNSANICFSINLSAFYTWNESEIFMLLESVVVTEGNLIMFTGGFRCILVDMSVYEPHTVYLYRVPTRDRKQVGRLAVVRLMFMQGRPLHLQRHGPRNINSVFISAIIRCSQQRPGKYLVGPQDIDLGCANGAASLTTILP